MFNRRQFQRKLFVACFSILPWKAAHTILNGEGLNLIKNEGAFVWLCLVVSDLSCGMKGVSLRSTDSSCCPSGTKESQFYIKVSIYLLPYGY